jgi:filamentous hemagglutinin
VLAKQGGAPDALTLKHLGIALSPLGATYASAGSDVPEVGAERPYTPDETVELITNYRNTHAAEYADNSINVVNLKGVYTGDITNKYASFYEKNLAVTPALSDLLSGTLSGIGLGAGNAWSGAYGAAWGLLSDPAGTSDQLVNGVVGLSKNPWGSFMDITEANQTKSAMAILYDMQGNSEASAAIRAQSDIEFVLNFLPANRAKTLAELGAPPKLDPLGPCNGDCRPVSVAGEGAKATTKVITEFGPMNQGPLPKGIADTFRSGTYSEVVTHNRPRCIVFMVGLRRS